MIPAGWSSLSRRVASRMSAFCEETTIKNNSPVAEITLLGDLTQPL